MSNAANFSRFKNPVNDEPDAEDEQEIQDERADAWQDQACDREADAKEKTK